MQNVLIVGVGQVGTAAARVIAEMGARVVAADLNPLPGFFARFGPARGAQLLALDMLDVRVLCELLTSQAIDTLVLSAGGTSGTAAQLWNVHVGGAEAVAQALRQVGIKRLVFVSSFAVYGSPPADALSETRRAQPESEYGRAKAAAESSLISLREAEVEVCILRPCGIYGPRPREGGSRSAQFIDSLLLHAVNGYEVTLQAPRNSADEYLYVEDLGRAIALAALNNTHAPEHIFNIGTGKKTTIKDLCETLQQVVPSARFKVEVTAEGERPIAPLDVSRAQRVLGFQSRYNLIEGLSAYLRRMKL